MTPFSAAVIQPFLPAAGDELEAMQASAWRMAAAAAARNARLMVLPEYFNVIALTPRQRQAAAADTASIKATAAKFSAEHQVWILLPLIEQRAGRLYNTAQLFGPDGRIPLSYDKTHLTLTERREWRLHPGNDLPVADLPIGRTGVMTCYDVYFPQVARLLCDAGADLLLFPSTQRSDSPERIVLLARARAIDNAVTILRASYGKRRDAPHTPAGTATGHSCIIAPDGTVLADAGEMEGIAQANIDPGVPWRRQRCSGGEPESVRSFLREDRRNDLYQAAEAIQNV